jgi:transcriptional regulator with XRE-family HTH domain
MNLAEKVKHLREVEGELRGLGRAMTQMEVVRAMQDEMDATISQAYLSQLENARRVHLTATSRDLLARFFKVQPGYLVNDLLDYSTDLLSEFETDSDRLVTWLEASAEEWRSEPLVQGFLKQLAGVENPRQFIALFNELLNLSAEDIASLGRPRHSEHNGAAVKPDVVN